MLAEGQLMERFGWTFDELDMQDSGRTFQTVGMMNLAVLYKDVLSAVQKHGTASLTDAHWEAFKLLHDV